MGYPLSPAPRADFINELLTRDAGVVPHLVVYDAVSLGPFCPALREGRQGQFQCSPLPSVGRGQGERVVGQCPFREKQVVTVQLNGELREVPEGLSLAALIEWLKLPRDRVAVERNLEIVPRARWNVTPIQAGDRLEVVHLVGGGSVVSGQSSVVSGQ